MLNQQIQNYKIVSLIGEGGMGDVYLGEHISINRKVAIKVLKPELAKNEEIRNRFKNEASLLAQLQHPNIVGLIDYIEQEDGLYLIMEYVEGKGLDELIKEQQSPLSIERSLKLMTQVLQAFQYAHENGIVHRDVKPSNILVTPDDRIKVLDFGIAKLIGNKNQHFTRTGMQLGTIYYMSPEQVKGAELDNRSDIYSLGVTLYEILSGACPYRSLTTEYEIFDTIVKIPLFPLTDTMGGAYLDVWKTIEKATQKEKQYRYTTCQEFIADLQSIPNKINDSTIIASQTEKSHPVKSSTSSKIWIVLPVLLIGLIGLAALIWFNSGSEEPKWVIESGKIEEGQDYSIYYSFYVAKSDSLRPYQTKVNSLIRNFILDNSFISETKSYQSKPLTREFFRSVLTESKKEAEKISTEYGSSIMDSVSIDTNFLNFDQVIMSMFGYQAGSTGWESISHKLVDKKTAQILELKDIVSDVQAFTSIAENCFRKQKGLVGIDGFTEEYTFENSRFYCPVNFYFRDGNLLFTYEKYEISYGAAGCISFQVPISEVSYLLRIDLSANTPMTNVKPEEKETIIQPISEEEVSTTMTNYYSDIIDGNFNANNYYADEVIQFVNSRNVTPADINEGNQGNSERTENSIFLDSESLTFDRTQNNIDYWRYSIYFVCFRESKGMYQSCNVFIEVGFDRNKKLVVYNELDVSNLEYTDYNPNYVGE